MSPVVLSLCSEERLLREGKVVGCANYTFMHVCIIAHQIRRKWGSITPISSHALSAIDA